jgi:hypothetical protein
MGEGWSVRWRPYFGGVTLTPSVVVSQRFGSEPLGRHPGNPASRRGN